jgi:hypothetical protein
MLLGHPSRAAFSIFIDILSGFFACGTFDEARGEGGGRGREKRMGSAQNSLQRLKKNIASAINRATETFAHLVRCCRNIVAETTVRTIVRTTGIYCRLNKLK